MKYLISLLTILTLFTACQKDILEKTDLSGLDERIWDEEGTATLYLNKVYALVMPTFPNMRSASTVPTTMHNVSDESNNGDTKALFGTLSEDNITDFYGAAKKLNAYGYIRSTNVILEGVDKGSMAQDGKNRVKGQALFLRAWVYFQLVKLYGGVPIVEGTQDWQEDDINVPRNTTRECFEFIVKDLDQSAAMLANGIPATQGSDRGRISKDIALAVKGRVLLYWASPQFNPGGAEDRWQAAYDANKLAYTTLVNTGAALFGNYAGVLTDESASNKEVIMIRSFSGALEASNVSNSYEHSLRPPSDKNGGGNASFVPTWELVKAYPMLNGRPSEVNGTAANGFDTLMFWKGRDPRFEASIAYNGGLWPLSNQSKRQQWTYNGALSGDGNTVTGFYSKRYVSTSLLALDSKKGKTDWIEMRLAEVMLNLAECANALGKTDEAYTMLELIRKRAGITNSDGKYGLLPAMASRQAMDDAIMHERQIELAFEGKRYDDLRRTRRFHLLNNQARHGLRVTLNTATKVNGKDLTAAILEEQDALGVRLRDKIDLNNEEEYLKYFKPQLVEIDKSDASSYKINFRDEYYFYAIPSPNLQKNPSLQQTIGWSGGKFDPLAQ